ncbi:hypothetical protein C3486_10565 [Streptomyces sp. Ru73]|uniref:hypothetical protein n=1 Tax=Streptomyces sp. Ru73 TaxID=2080748 RepID=UPI000CDD6C62|nr:hypothetical protein [Streptomyces sp. Ru73]POX41214.1 hypothetical protein C3486_10565 [Streptomyces sp. Ru73]
MIVTLVVLCEVAFWVLLVVGLALRYLARMPRTGAAVLLTEPLLELVLLVVTVIDLRNGAQADWKHGLAAVYIGFTVAYGHYTIRWADGQFAYRFAGGPKPPGPGYGRARAVHEWKLWLRTVVMGLVAAGLLQAAILYVGDGDTASLRMWQIGVARVVGIHGLIALTYTIWPKRPKKGEREPGPAGTGDSAGERPRSLTKP